jgi:hypothetical protein
MGRPPNNPAAPTPLVGGQPGDWFRQADSPESERVPILQGRSNEQIRKAIAPLNGRLSKRDIDRIAHAIGLVIDTDAMIALTDAVGLDVAAAKKTLLDASRWLLAGALAELNRG